MDKRKQLWISVLVFAAICSKIPAESEKPSIAVLPLTRITTISEEEADTLTLLLETGIVQAGNLQVVERRQISAILEEQ